MTKDVSVYRDCKHGQLKRSCELCANEQDIAELQAKVQEQALQIISLIGQEIDAEPVVWIYEAFTEGGYFYEFSKERKTGNYRDPNCWTETPLYTAPPLREPEQSEPYGWVLREVMFDDDGIPLAHREVKQNHEQGRFLANGMRFKTSQFPYGVCINGLPKELNGRWVALVAAEDDCHLKPAPPLRELSPEEIDAVLRKVGILANLETLREIAYAVLAAARSKT